jgi:hypothetical protein
MMCSTMVSFSQGMGPLALVRAYEFLLWTSN